MYTEIKVPDLPDFEEVVKIGKIYVELGQYVNVNDTLFDIETDKVVLEVAASSAGIVKQVNFKQGQIVVGQQVVIYLEDSEQMAIFSRVDEIAQHIHARKSSDQAQDEPVVLGYESSTLRTLHPSISYGLVGVVLGILISTLMLG